MPAPRLESPPDAPPPSESQREPPDLARRMLWMIFAAVGLWGIYHAIGAYQQNPLRSVVILAVVLGYLGCWLLLLWHLNRRRER